MKEGWENIKLGNLATYINGFAFKPSDWEETGLPIIRIQNLTDDTKKPNRCNRNDIPLKYFVKKGDILISWSATLGIFEWQREDALLNQHIFKVVFDKKSIVKNYFKYVVEASLVEMSKHTNGATMQHIRKGDFDNISVPVPPMDEQLRIVKILDDAFAKIDKLKANAQKNLANAKALFQATLKKELTPKPDWQTKKLGEVLKTGAGGTPNSKTKTYYENGKIPWLRSGEVCRKHITETEMFITEDGMRNSSAKLFPINTVVVAMYGATAGQVGILKIESTTNQAVCGIFPDVNYSEEYLYYFLLNNKDSLVAQAVGNAQPNISQLKIKNIDIPLVDLEIQKSIVERMNFINTNCEYLKINSEKTIAECDALKQSILRKAFNGEL